MAISFSTHSLHLRSLYQPWLWALRTVSILLLLLPPAIIAKRGGALTVLGIVLSLLTHLNQVLTYKWETEARLMKQLAWGPHSKQRHN